MDAFFKQFVNPRDDLIDPVGIDFQSLGTVRLHAVPITLFKSQSCPPGDLFEVVLIVVKRPSHGTTDDIHQTAGSDLMGHEPTCGGVLAVTNGCLEKTKEKTKRARFSRPRGALMPIPCP